MSLIEKINKEQINKVISYSQCIPDPRTDELLETWAKKKEKLSKTFLKGEVIYTYPNIVNFEISEDVKRERINDFISFAALLLSYQHPLVEFLTEISTNEFYNNSLEKPYTIYYATDEKKINAQIFIDGVEIFEDTYIEEAGEHTIKIVGAGNYKKTFTIKVENPNITYTIIATTIVSICLLGVGLLLIRRKRVI
jgi:hypothetical protein